jgi:hypothetical protein
MSLLNEETIRSSKNRLKCEKVSTPEWAENGDGDPHVFVRMLHGEDNDAAIRLLGVDRTIDGAQANAAVRMCVLCVCDAELNPLLTEEAIPDLLAGPLAPITRCFMKAIKINGMDDDSQAALAKNSGRAPTDASPSI